MTASVAADVAKVLGGRPNGAGFLCRCPLPSHGKGKGDRNPSLSVADGDDALLVHCFGGCDPRDVLDELRRLRLLENGLAPVERSDSRRQQSATVEPDPLALALWREARPDGEVVGAYLRRRGITLPPPPTIRQTVDLLLGRTPGPRMVCAVQASDRRVIAVQALWLTWEGRKAAVSAARKSIGSLHDGAVRLAAAGEVLGLAEGVETGLSAMQLAGVPVWAALGGRLNAIGIPDQVRELHVFGDNDEPGRRAADRAAERWVKRGLTVQLRFPPAGCGDWNDALQPDASRQATA